MKRKFILALSLILIASLFLTGCELFNSRVTSLKGELKGVSYNIEFYDNFGEKYQHVKGQNIDIEGKKVKETGYDSEGNVITNYTLSSVVAITIDGHQMESCGSTVIFAEEGLQKDIDFTIQDIDSENSKGLSGYTSVAKIVNNYSNFFGKPSVVVIQSQLGVPICAYSGNSVFWEVCENLPKTTMLSIDGKVLYIHRANFEIIDKALID